MTITKAKSFQDYGRLGGEATLARYGKEFFAHIGRRGGRPHQKTLIQLRQQSAPETENKVREGMAARPNNLRALKELWTLRNKNGELGSLAAPSPPERSVIEV